MSDLLVGRWVRVGEGDRALGRVVALDTDGGAALILFCHPSSVRVEWVHTERIRDVSIDPHERETFKKGAPVGGRYSFKED